MATRRRAAAAVPLQDEDERDIMGGLSKEEFADVNLVKALNAAIRDRTKPKPALCIPAVACGLILVKSAPYFGRVARTRYTDLLDTALLFVSTPMSNLELVVLEKKWKDCRCDRTHALLNSIHNMAERNIHEYDSLSRLVTTLLAFINDVLDLVTPTRLLKSASKGKWPPSASHLLPGGPEVEIRAMLCWLRFTQRENPCQSLPFLYLTSLVEICPSLQRPIVASDELLDRFVDSLGSVASALESGGPVPDDMFPEPIEALQHLLLFFSSLEECLVENVDNHEMHYARHSKVAFPIIERLEAVLKPLKADEVDDLERMRFSLEDMARTFWLGLPAAGRPERKFPRFTQQLMSMFDELDSLYFTTIKYWTQLDGCAGPSCLRPGEDFPEPLKLCQRCRVLRYCSRECQKEHWTWKRSPHKATCQLVGQFGALVKPILKMEEHSEDKYDLFCEAVNTAGYSWDDVKVAFDALEALTFQKEALYPPLREYQRPNKK